LIAAVPPAVTLSVLLSTGTITASTTAIIALSLAGGLLWIGRPSRGTERPAPEPRKVETAAIPQDILERLPDAVILLNGNREIIAVNRIARDTLGVGEVGRDLALTLRHPAVLAAVETLFAGVPSISEEVSLPAPTPRTFTLHAGSLGEDGGSAGPRAILVLHDETRAKRAEQSRADFVANASHELRSPLSALIGFIETLRGPASDDAAARERFLGVMHEEALRMARLVEDLMSLSRVEINEHVPPRNAVDIGDVLSSVADPLQVRARAKQMTIDIDCPPGLPKAIGDADQLIQVVHNLVDNAVKYGRPGTPIRIVAGAVDRLPGGGRGVSIAVSDRGDGIAAIHLPRLTERFYRVDEGRSRRLGGTGLGLAIVKHIVNRHRGRLSIESRVGEGSVFTVVLPAAEAEEAANIAPRRGRKGGRRTGGTAVTKV
jgi:two-component system phosphate regulon sensor histidine kinase PhoR